MATAHLAAENGFVKRRLRRIRKIRGGLTCQIETTSQSTGGCQHVAFEADAVSASLGALHAVHNLVGRDFKNGWMKVFEVHGRGQCASAVASAKMRSSVAPCSSAARGVWPSNTVAGDSRNDSNCQPSPEPKAFAKGCNTGQMVGSNCQRGNLKPRRRCATPMQRPALIQPLTVTRVVPASAAVFMRVFCKSCLQQIARPCGPYFARPSVRSFEPFTAHVHAARPLKQWRLSKVGWATFSSFRNFRKTR